MATRQYIGARYVPKFYQNSVDGSTQWEANVVYEPLIYVTLQNGHMYISKKQVPATVGTPAQNIDYWLDIGDYNGYIEELQNEIDAVTGRVSTLETSRKKVDNIITIGDSYSVLSGITSWPELLDDYMDFQVHYHNGTGGSAFNHGARNFLTLLTELENTVTDPNSIEHILVAGGINDCISPNTTNIVNNMIAFDTYARAHYPNAVIHLAFLGTQSVNSSDSQSRSASDIETVIQFYQYQSGRLNWHFIKGAEYVLKNYTLLGSDGLHPTAAGEMFIATALVEGLNTGCCDVHFNIGNVPATAVTLASGVTKVTTNPIIDWIHIDNDIVEVAFAPNRYTLSVAQGTTYPPATIDLFTFNEVCPFITAADLESASGNVRALVGTTNSGFYEVTLKAYVQNGIFKIAGKPVMKHDGTTYAEDTITQLNMVGFSMKIPTLWL